MAELKVEMWPIERCIPYCRNPRKNDEQVDRMASAIKEFGFRIPIVAKSDGSLVDGHLRLKAAQKLGLKEVPVALADELTEAQVKAFRILANKSANWAEWEPDLLKLELQELQELDFDLELTGFELPELDEILGAGEQAGTEGQTDPDAVPEAQDEPVSRLGDVWLLGGHRLMCGDSTDAGSVALLMNGEKADMVFTDPPYGMRLDTDYTTSKKNLQCSFMKEKHLTGGKCYPPVIGDNEDFSPALINTVFENFGYCKEIFMFGADYYAELLLKRNAGSWIVWDKRIDENADKMQGSCFELCWSKAKHKREIARVKWVYIFGTEKEFDHQRHHPTQKPIDLAVWFLNRYADDGATVADLYGGSGSTLIACEKTGRVCRMMELSPRYVDVIVRRWQDFTGQEATLEDGRTFARVKEERGG